MRVKLGLLIILCILSFGYLSAQDLNGRVSVGLHTGVTIFYGDVKKHEFAPSLRDPNEVRLAGGLQLTYAFNPYFSMRYYWASGSLAGARPAQNDKFNARFNDHSVQAMINMTSIFFYDEDRAFIDIYGMLGYGLVGFRTRRVTFDDNRLLSQFGYSRDNPSEAIKPTRELSIPVGVSLRTRVDRFLPGYRSYGWDKLELMLDIMLFLVNTDKLDALETGSGKDRYSYFSFGAAYFFLD